MARANPESAKRADQLCTPRSQARQDRSQTNRSIVTGQRRMAASSPTPIAVPLFVDNLDGVPASEWPPALFAPIFSRTRSPATAGEGRPVPAEHRLPSPLSIEGGETRTFRRLTPPNSFLGEHCTPLVRAPSLPGALTVISPVGHPLPRQQSDCHWQGAGPQLGPIRSASSRVLERANHFDPHGYLRRDRYLRRYRLDQFQSGGNGLIRCHFPFLSGICWGLGGCRGEGGVAAGKGPCALAHEPNPSVYSTLVGPTVFSPTLRRWQRSSRRCARTLSRGRSRASRTLQSNRPQRKTRDYFALGVQNLRLGIQPETNVAVVNGRLPKPRKRWRLNLEHRSRLTKVFVNSQSTNELYRSTVARSAVAGIGRHWISMTMDSANSSMVSAVKKKPAVST